MHVQRSSCVHALTPHDVTAFAAPFAGAIGPPRCTFAHGHRGLPSEGWLAFLRSAAALAIGALILTLVLGFRERVLPVLRERNLPGGR